jgi:hypothetical protein
MQAAYTKIDEGSGPLYEAVRSIAFLCLCYPVMLSCGALRREKSVTVKACGGVASDTMGTFTNVYARLVAFKSVYLD